MTNSKLQQAQNQTVQSYFINQVANYLQDIPDVIGEGEGKRLAFNLVVKSSEALENGGYEWQDVDVRKLTMDYVRMVTLGLDASNDECYVVPYNNKKTQKVDLDCMISAKGLKKLVMQYAVGRKIIDFRAFAIREGDNFRLTRTPGDDKWEYQENIFGSGKVIGYVTIIIYEDGTSNVMTHSLADIEARRQASKSPNSPAWAKWPIEMALAKATRRHCKSISIKLPDAQEKALNAAEQQEIKEVQDSTPLIEIAGTSYPVDEDGVIEGYPDTESQPKQPEAPAGQPEQCSFDESWMEV